MIYIMYDKDDKRVTLRVNGELSVVSEHTFTFDI